MKLSFHILDKQKLSPQIYHETLEEIKAKLVPKKSSIPLDMLDTANSYDDKVAVLRMLAADDPGRVANSIKRLIEA